MKDRSLFAWTATAILALFTAVCGWSLYAEPSPLAGFATGSMLLATVLIFPPLWKNLRSRGLQRARITAVVLLAGVGFLMPVKTHVVKFDLPAQDR